MHGVHRKFQRKEDYFWQYLKGAVRGRIRGIYFTRYTISFLYLLITSTVVLILSKDFLRSREDTIHDNDKPGAQRNTPDP